MFYLLTLVALLTGFLWATPAHQRIADALNTDVPITAHLQSAVATARTKTVELFRRELHRAIDSLIR